MGDASLGAESSLLSKKVLLNLPTCLNVCVGRVWSTVPPTATQVFPHHVHIDVMQGCRDHGVDNRCSLKPPPTQALFSVPVLLGRA